MELGIVVMGIIILINLIVVGTVMYVGTRHDTHTEIRSPESSRAVQILQAQQEAAQRKFREHAAPDSSPAETAPQPEEKQVETAEGE